MCITTEPSPENNKGKSHCLQAYMIAEAEVGFLKSSNTPMSVSNHSSYQLRGKFCGHIDSVQALAVRSDGALLASGGN